MYLLSAFVHRWCYVPNSCYCTAYLVPLYFMDIRNSSEQDGWCCHTSITCPVGRGAIMTTT